MSSKQSKSKQQQRPKNGKKGKKVVILEAKPPKIAGKGDYKVTEFFTKSEPSKGIVNKGARAAGNWLGNATGIPGAGQLLGNAASNVSRLFGFGDYRLKIRKNSLLKSTGQTPVFANHASCVYSNKEFVTDIYATSEFTNRSFIINPGNPQLCPWLKDIASKYEEYEFLGLAFEYKPMTSNVISNTSASLGTIIMAAQYNVESPPFSTKQEMEVTEFASSGSPIESQMHFMECDPAQNLMSRMLVGDETEITQYTDTGDARIKCQANFQVATVGMQTTGMLGELWVTYKVRLLKPKLAIQQPIVSSSVQYNYACVNSDPPNVIGISNNTLPPGLTFGGSFDDGNPQVSITCESLSSAGTYMIVQNSCSNVSTTAFPGWVATLPSTFLIGNSYFQDLGTNVDGTHEGTGRLYLPTASTGGCNDVVTAHFVTACSFNTIVTFTQPGDGIGIPILYGGTGEIYNDLYVVPFNTTLPLMKRNIFKGRPASASFKKITISKDEEDSIPSYKSSEMRTTTEVEIKQPTLPTQASIDSQRMLNEQRRLYDEARLSKRPLPTPSPQSQH